MKSYETKETSTYAFTVLPTMMRRHAKAGRPQLNGKLTKTLNVIRERLKTRKHGFTLEEMIEHRHLATL